MLSLSSEFAPGAIDAAISLDGGVADSDGVLLIANSENPALGASDVAVPDLDFFGSPQSFLLVSGFTGTQGDDLDSDNNGTLDSEPYGEVLAELSLIDGDSSTDFSYSPTVLGPDGDFAPAAGARLPNGSGDFTMAAFDDASDDTPGALNEEDDITPPGDVATIMEIQGAGHVSPFVRADGQSDAEFFAALPADTSSISGARVTTSGIVTAVDSNGFYLQDPQGDDNPATSDAIFVFTGSAPAVAIGDAAEVTATVSEFFPGSTDTRNLPTTQLSDASVTVQSSGNPLPGAVVLGASGRIAPSAQIDDDAFASFDPQSDGADYFEAVEAMLVTAEDTIAIAPTNRFGEIFVVANGGDDATGLSERGTLNISPVDFNPEKIQIDSDSTISPVPIPDVDVGTELGDVTGVIGYAFGNYELIPTQPFGPLDVGGDEFAAATSIEEGAGLSPEISEITGSEGKLTIASYNVLNLDPNDSDDDTDVADGRFTAIAQQIAGNLNSPDIIGLQEIQDNNGAARGVTGTGVVSADETLELLIAEIAEAGGPDYVFIDNTFITEDASGGFPGGNIRTAFLYNPARVDLVEGSVQTISGQGSGQAFEGARLPLVAEFAFGDETVTVVNNHFSSKGGSAPIIGIEQPFETRQEDASVNGSLDERQLQAQAVNDFVDTVLAEDAEANLVVLGDLNEFEFVAPLGILDGRQEFDGTTANDTPENQVLSNLINEIAPDERYSFIFQGNSQELDHILVSDALTGIADVDIVHVNSEFAETESRASDHDPVLASFDFSTTESNGVTKIARGTTGIFDDSAAEIVSHENGRFYVSNSEDKTIDVYEQFGDELTEVDEISAEALGGAPNSVDVKNGIVAVAVEGAEDTENGMIKLFDATTLEELASFDALGVLPDMLSFTKDGTQIYVAIEGEPGDESDPEGGVTIIDLNFDNLPSSTVSFIDFRDFDGQEDALRAEGVHIAPGVSASQDFEPEYIAEGQGELAVTLQENNALAIIDLATKTVKDVVALGYKDHSLSGNGLDASDRDEAINIANWPVFGMYQPDTIASYEVGGKTYYVTANEGDARDLDERIKKLDLDPTAFPNAEALQEDEAIGRLQVATDLGDTDGDGDYDALYAYGARSFSIWDETGTLVFDSGDDFEQVIAAQLPDQFNGNNDDPFDVDTRSDNKGPEPEAIAVAEIEGRQIAIIGLERQNALVFYDVTDPANSEFLRVVSTVDPADQATGEPFPNSDLGPESIEVIAPEDSSTGNTQIAVASEVSGTVTLYDLENLIVPETTYTLELLHVADQEAGANAIIDAPNLSAVMNALEAQDLGNDGMADNTIRLSSGDAFIPGVFYDASSGVFGAAGIADIQIQNELGFEAIALGNHEFDFGTKTLAELIAGKELVEVEDSEGNLIGYSYGDALGDFSALSGTALDGLDFTGAAFPYLSSNLDVSSDLALADLETAGGQAPQANVVTSSTVLEENGELIGVVGATTPTLASISSPGGVGIAPNWADTTPTSAELDALAAEIQAEVDALLAANTEMNKVILLAHMQQIEIEEALAERLENVDIIVAGGSNTRLFDENDVPRPGDSVQGEYPIEITNAGGTTTLVVNTDGSYKYVGRLVIEFDADGNIIPESYDPTVSGAYATDDAGVAALNAEALVDPEIQAIADAIEAEIIEAESNVFGVSSEFLNGNRSGVEGDADGVRTQETNLGNLTADANLAYAQSQDDTVMVSLKNGGGIRASIGETIVPPGGSEPVRTPNAELVDSEGDVIKPAGGISENDINTTLAFNNELIAITVTRAELVELLEHGISALPGVSGRFPQISGVQFSFDPDATAGDRIQSAAIVDAENTDLDVLMENGALVGDPDGLVRVVTLEFLARPRFDDEGNFIGGGDGYPFPNYNTDPSVGEVGADAARINPVNLAEEGVQDGAATFADNGTEQDVLAEYLAANFADAETAFDQADNGPDGDERIQNLNFREDTVIDEGSSPAEPLKFVGTRRDDVFVGDSGDDQFLLRFGDDMATGKDGADLFIIDARYLTLGDVFSIKDFDASEGDAISFRFFDQKITIDSAEDLAFYAVNGFTSDTDQFGPVEADIAVSGSEVAISFAKPEPAVAERFIGTRRDDMFDGQGGDDEFLLRFGDDTATGGSGADDFIFDARYVDSGSTHAITDLDFGEGDTLTLRGFAERRVTISSDDQLAALDDESFASLMETEAGTLLTLTNDAEQSMEIALFSTTIV
ncbi:MAG: choice-of-anchor I family protein [Mangrovicoccus sp.]|nr:choice-of-anchor I family protein [Mangrovicoccus sp.]